VASSGRARETCAESESKGSEGSGDCHRWTFHASNSGVHRIAAVARSKACHRHPHDSSLAPKSAVQRRCAGNGAACQPPRFAERRSPTRLRAARAKRNSPHKTRANPCRGRRCTVRLFLRAGSPRACVRRGRPVRDAAQRSPAANHALQNRAEEYVGINHLEGACLIELAAQLRRDRKVERRQVIVEVSQFRGADDRRSDPRLRSHPLERHLRRSSAQLLRYGCQSVEHPPVVLGELMEDGVRRVFHGFEPPFTATRAALPLVLPA